MDKGLLEFLKEYHPEALEQYKRLITPFYWECGVEYYPQQSGCGGSGKDYKKLILQEVYFFKDKKCFSLRDIPESGHSYSISELEAPFKLKRVDEKVQYHDNIIHNKERDIKNETST